MQTLYNFLPFLFIKCLTFSKISWWNMMSLTTCTVWWNMMQNLIQNLNWNIAISLDTHRLMWFFFFPEENYSQEQSVPRRSGIAGEWHSPHINLFPIRTWEQFWCLGGFKISSNVTSPLTVSSIYSQKPEQNKTNNKTAQKNPMQTLHTISSKASEGGNKNQFKCLNSNTKSQGSKTE